MPAFYFLGRCKVGQGWGRKEELEDNYQGVSKIPGTLGLFPAFVGSVQILGSQILSRKPFPVLYPLNVLFTTTLLALLSPHFTGQGTEADMNKVF